MLLVALVGQIQLEARTGNPVTGLVHLDDRTLWNGNQIVLQAHVGLYISPLQVEEVQSVEGAVGQRIRVVPEDASQFLLLFHPVDGDVPVDEVDGHGGHIVDAAQVRHQRPVNEDPHVIVAAEFISNGSL